MIVGRHAAINRRPPFCGLSLRLCWQLLSSFSGMGDCFCLVLGNVLVFWGVLQLTREHMSAGLWEDGFHVQMGAKMEVKWVPNGSPEASWSLLAS